MAGDEYVELNMDHPLNKLVAEVAASTTRSQFEQWLSRQHKKIVFSSLLTSEYRVMYPRSHAIRSMVASFKAGHLDGHQRGWRRCERHYRKKARRAKDGR